MTNFNFVKHNILAINASNYAEVILLLLLLLLCSEEKCNISIIIYQRVFCLMAFTQFQTLRNEVNDQHYFS